METTNYRYKIRTLFRDTLEIMDSLTNEEGKFARLRIMVRQMRMGDYHIEHIAYSIVIDTITGEVTTLFGGYPIEES